MRNYGKILRLFIAFMVVVFGVQMRSYAYEWSEESCSECHSFEETLTPATPTTDGEIRSVCTKCGVIDKSLLISRVGYVELSYETCIYNGKAKKPSVEVTSFLGEILKKGTDYTLEYKDNVNVGTASVIIVLMGRYSGTIEKTFSINPQGTVITSVHSESRKATVKWKKQPSQITGYEIEYEKSYPVGKKKIMIVNNKSLTSKTIYNLANNSHYCLRIRTYKDVNGKKYYSNWSQMEFAHVRTPYLSDRDISLYRGQEKQLTLRNIPIGARPKWKSSNHNIATVSKSGRIIAKQLGKVTISAEYNGKVYKTRVNVTYYKPDMAALLYKYNTHDNYFVLTITNNSKKKMTVLKGKSQIVEFEYAAFDRTVNLSKSVTIKPGESKKIRFDVIGDVTWYDYSGYTLYYKFMLDGKTYDAKADSFVTSKYKSGSSWKKTYLDDDWFIQWRMDTIPPELPY
ncbi:MAG: Ig-like domain-containing protein [Wujia sp.]